MTTPNTNADNIALLAIRKGCELYNKEMPNTYTLGFCDCYDHFVTNILPPLITDMLEGVAKEDYISLAQARHIKNFNFQPFLDKLGINV